MIPFQRPDLPATAEIDAYLELSRRARWFSNGGPCWRLLSERLGERVGAYCVPAASGTLGLMAALATVLGEGGRAGGAAVPSFTFIATAQAALWAGLEPRLADVDPEHWHLDPERLERALEAGGIEVAIPVSAFGTPPPAEVRQRWERACREAGVPLVVDSAAGFGAVAEDGVPVGAQGDVEVVSFHATKPFAIGEGGAIFTRDRALHERLEQAVNFGFRPDRSVGLGHGLNAKMSELHAATALAMLDRLDAVLARRREAAAAIRAAASSDCAWQAGCERSTWQFVPVALPDAERRRRLEEACAGRVEARVYYEPLGSLQPGRWPTVGGEIGETEDLHGRLLCLPMANDLSDAEQAEIGALLGAA